MVHRPLPDVVDAPAAGWRSPCLKSDDEDEDEDDTQSEEEEHWKEDDVGEEAEDSSKHVPSAPFSGRIAQERFKDPSHFTKSTELFDDFFARGDPRRFHFLLSELASEYNLVTGCSQTDGANCGKPNPNWLSSSTMSKTSSLLDVSGPGFPRYGQSSSFLGRSHSANRARAGSSSKAAIANWENLFRNVSHMQSSCTQEVRDFWQYKATPGHPHSSRSWEDFKSTPSQTSYNTDMILAVWNRRSGAWLQRRDRSFRSITGRSCIAIHPDSTQHLLWALLGLLFVIMDIFYFTMSVFGIGRPLALVWADCVFWSVDVFFHFRLGFRVKDETVMSLPRIARQYLRTWFPFDVVLMTSGWLFLFFDELSGSSARAVRHLRLVRLIRLVRVSKLATSINEVAFRFQSDSGTLIFKMVMYMSAVVFWIHFSACLYFWIGDHEGGWTATIRARAGETSPGLLYIVSVHWAASQLQGSIDVYPSYDLWERAFVVVNLLGSIAVLAMVVSNITTLLGAIQAAKLERNLVFNTARRFAELHGVRAEVLLEVYRYLAKRRQYQAREQEATAEAELFSHLPFQLRRRLLEEARWPQLRNKLVFVSFGHCSKQFQTQLLCDVLHNAVHLPDHLVFQYGSICSRLYVLTSGDAHYTRYAKTFAALLSGESAIHAGLTSRAVEDDEVNVEIQSKSTLSSPGAFQMFEDRHRQLQGGEVGAGALISEFSLWTPWLHKGDLEASGELTLFTINIVAFGELVASFSSVQKQMRGHAHRVVAFLRIAEEPSDLMSSEHVMEGLADKPKALW